MSEDYRIISAPRGEPRPAGCVGVRVRFQLSGSPSRRWSRGLGARLACELLGHPSVGHLRIDANQIVQGDQIVLDGVEAGEAATLAGALERAIDASNRAAIGEPMQAPNVTQHEADAIAGQISVGRPPD